MIPLKSGHVYAPPPSYTVRVKSHGHSASVQFGQEPFKAHGRRLTWIIYREGGEAGTTNKPTNGKDMTFLPAYGSRKPKHFWGLDSMGYEETHRMTAAQWLASRCSELSAMNVTVDGHRWQVSQSDIRGLLNPILEKDYAKIELSQDGRRLIVILNGSDGAGAYTATWQLRSNGRNTRNVGSAD